MISYTKTVDKGILGFMRQNKRRLSIAGYIVISIYIIFSFVFSDLGLFKYFVMRGERDHLNNAISHLGSENKSLREEVTKLKTDPDYIESLARDKLGLVKEGETIYKFEDKRVTKDSSGQGDKGSVNK